MPCGAAVSGMDSITGRVAGEKGSGVGLAEPGVALTVQDGWMAWGVWVWLSAPTGTWCPVAGDKLSNDGRSKQARRTTQEGKLPCGAEVSGADSERVGPTGDRTPGRVSRLVKRAPS